MVRINTELMLQRRIQLGWTSEELAEKSELDARTIRRLEQGKTRPRLHTAIAVARALTLDTSTFISHEGSLVGELGGRPGAGFKVPRYTFQRDPDEDRLTAAFKAAADTFKTNLTCEGDQGFREIMYVLSLLLTKALATEGKELAKQEDDGVHEVIAAFKAADVAIRKTLSGRGDLRLEDAICVLSLLLTRFGIAFSRPENDPMTGLSMIQVASDQAYKALSDHLGFPRLNVAISGEPRTGDAELRKGDLKIGKDIILRRSSR